MDAKSCPSGKTSRKLCDGTFKSRAMIFRVSRARSDDCAVRRISSFPAILEQISVIPSSSSFHEQNPAARRDLQREKNYPCSKFQALAKECCIVQNDFCHKQQLCHRFAEALYDSNLLKSPCTTFLLPDSGCCIAPRYPFHKQRAITSQKNCMIPTCRNLNV